MASGDEAIVIVASEPEERMPAVWTWPLWDRTWAIVAWFLPVRREATAVEREAIREAAASAKQLAAARVEVDQLRVEKKLDTIRIENLALIIAYHEARLKAAADIEAAKAVGRPS